MNKKIYIGPIALFLLVAVIFIMMGVSGIAPKSNKLETYNVEYAKEVIEVEHRLWYIIPVGSEHYYMTLLDDETANPKLVRADESWYSENFDSEGKAKGTVSITGLTRNTDYKVQSSISNINYDFAEYNVRISETSYADSTYKRYAALEIVMGVLIAAVVLILFVTYKLVTNYVIEKGGAAVKALVSLSVIMGIALIVIGFCVFSYI